MRFVRPEAGEVEEEGLDVDGEVAEIGGFEEFFEEVCAVDGVEVYEDGFGGISFCVMLVSLMLVPSSCNSP